MCGRSLGSLTDVGRYLSLPQFGSAVVRGDTVRLGFAGEILALEADFSGWNFETQA